jgi:nucleotide-binding universal stress UspA family protein
LKPERILLPIDIRKCPLDVLQLVDGLALRTGVAVTLLHVVTLNVLPLESRIYQELVAETQWFLERLIREYLPGADLTRARVRVGKATGEILAEASKDSVDLIVMPNHGPSFWRRISSIWEKPAYPMVSAQVAKIMGAANCSVFIASSRVRFDCEKEWGRPTEESLIRFPRSEESDESPTTRDWADEEQPAQGRFASSANPDLLFISEFRDDPGGVF